MKKYNLAAMAILAIACTLWFTACQNDDIDALGTVNPTNENAPGNPTGFDLGAGTAGKTNAQLTQDYWKYALSFDCAHSPLFDVPFFSTSAQNSSVVFLIGAKGGVVTRDIIVSGKQTLVLPVINILSDLPCDPSFKLAPGQTVQTYLKAKARKVIDLAGAMKVSLDGTPVDITGANRISTDLFYFIGNKDLANCFDPCITGKSQAGVSDGYWVFLKGLSRGKHVLYAHAEIQQLGMIIDVTYNITVL